jgi:hypothetical protein
MGGKDSEVFEDEKISRMKKSPKDLHSTFFCITFAPILITKRYSLTSLNYEVFIK